MKRGMIVNVPNTSVKIMIDWKLFDFEPVSLHGDMYKTINIVFVFPIEYYRECNAIRYKYNSIYYDSVPRRRLVNITPNGFDGLLFDNSKITSLIQQNDNKITLYGPLGLLSQGYFSVPSCIGSLKKIVFELPNKETCILDNFDEYDVPIKLSKSFIVKIDKSLYEDYLFDVDLQLFGYITSTGDYTTITCVIGT
jgi:hypothetical protein